MKTAKLACAFMTAYWLIPSTNLWSCHPECSWQCDDPVCPAICEKSCPNLVCQNAACLDANCTCEKFSSPTIDHCEPPNDGPCPTCTAKVTGSDCQDNQGKFCECQGTCQIFGCVWDCQTPLHCRPPRCELMCERPACEAQE